LGEKQKEPLVFFRITALIVLFHNSIKSLFVSFCPEKRKFSFVLKRNEAIMFVIIIIFCIFAAEKD
jgi:hypothetical protein